MKTFYLYIIQVILAIISTWPTDAQAIILCKGKIVFLAKQSIFHNLS